MAPSLKQIEYRTYLRIIELFHYPHHLMPISQFQQLISAQKFGFVRRLESADTLCNDQGEEKNFIPDGDEVPTGFTEVAYLFNVFRRNRKTHATGSALGFRLLDEDRIEWMCFDRPIHKLLAEVTTEGGVCLFDKVADLERGENVRKLKGSVKGHPEHRQWFDGLRLATKPFLKFSIVEERRALLDELKARDDLQAVAHFFGNIH